MAMADLFDIDSVMYESDDEMFDSDSDSDFELFNLFTYFDPRKAIRRTFRTNHFETCTDDDFFLYFRLTKPTVLKLLEQIEDKLKTPQGRDNSVSPMNQLLLTLRFYALGRTQEAAGDFVGVHKSAACVFVRRVSKAIAGLGPVHIRLPQTSQEIRQTQLKFYQRARFPRVIGCVDSTHVQILSPDGNNEVYRNPKGYFSLNVQTVCDCSMRITDVVARWPGSESNQTIFDNSGVRANMEMGRLGFLLGDRSYVARPYLMTPLGDVQSPDEELYNESQARTRNEVGMLYYSWKHRFPILVLGIKVSTEEAQEIIMACAVLHNLAKDAGEAVPPWDPQMPSPDFARDQIPPTFMPDHDADHFVRTGLVENYFRTLLEQYEQREP